ncbi:NAD(P)H-binding protein [Georgenia halophila]
MSMRRHHRAYAVRAHLLEMSGRFEAAAEDYARAAALSTSIPEQRYLNRRARNAPGARNAEEAWRRREAPGDCAARQRTEQAGMNVFIIGITGGVGGLLAEKLRSHGDAVHGLVRREDQQAGLAAQGVDARVGDLAGMTAEELAAAFAGSDAIVYTAGSNGGSREVTTAIDGDGVAKAIEAARVAGVDRLALVSVLPESWREHDLGEEVEYYFAVKKGADIALTRSDLDWLILRPSLLLDEPGSGTISLGPAEAHGQISRDDVAETLAELLHEPGIGRQILELNAGSTPVREAVRANVRGPLP